MRAALRIDTFVRQTQPLYRPAANQVFRNDLFGVGSLHMAIPDRFRVDHHRGAMLALIQASSLVDAHCAAQSGGLYKLLQLRQKLTLAILRTRGPRSALGTNILTDKHMAFKRGQNGKSSNCHDIG